MSSSFLDSEVETWYFFMLSLRYPFIASVFVRDAVFALQQEGPIALADLHLTGLPLVLAVYWLLGRLKSTRSRLFGTLFYYEIVQVMQVGFALQYPHLSSLFVIVSTIILVHQELSLLLGTVQNGALIAKHLLLWGGYIWKTTGTVEINVDVMMNVTAALIHFWHFVLTRSAALESRQENVRELKAEKERMQALLQAIPDGVAVLTEDRKVVAHNQMLLQMLQLDGKDNYEDQLSTAFGLLKYAPLYRKTASVCEYLLEDVIEHIAKERENTSIDFGSVVYLGHYLEWRGTTSNWNKSRACILIVRDVGEWVELEALAKKESEAKSALIRSVSHELRTPINAIINISERLMESPSFSDDQKELCQILVSSSHFLLSNVNDLLDFSRIANQQFSLNKQLFNLKAAVRTCTELIESQCRLKGLQMNFRYDSSIPSLVYNDANRLKQVLLNLLSNGLKFTLKGKIEVVTTLVHANMVKITVEDSGIGITRANQRKLFTLFGRLTGNEKLNPQGCGLGLTISNTLVMRMGGTGITVKSEPGKGSTFSFLLPIGDDQLSSFAEEIEYHHFDTSSSEVWDLAEGVEGVHLPASNALWRDPQSRANTLIADDSEFNRVVLKQLLELQGFICEEANSGGEALRKIEQRARENSPFLYIFLDIEMPEMSGIEVALELRRQVAEGTLAKAQVVGCSAYVSLEDRQNCLDSGMDFFLEKPVSRASLTILCSRIRVYGSF